MPPRYAYWTILVDNQPTAFRAGAQEDLLPTFKRLKEKHPSAVMMWFQNGKLWNSRLDAQEAMRARGEMGRRGDERQGAFREHDRKPPRARANGERKRSETRARREWTPKPATHAPRAMRAEKLDWKPKGTFPPAPKRPERPEWKPKSGRPEARRFEKPEWKAKPSQADRTKRREPLDWKPKPVAPAGRAPDGAPAKRKWIPKEEYKKAKGIEVPRDSKWRPGGVHRDPRQKYKDAKKAKWTGFKKAIRTKWEAKRKRTDEK
jgi:hypothetical protein